MRLGGGFQGVSKVAAGVKLRSEVKFGPCEKKVSLCEQSLSRHAVFHQLWGLSIDLSPHTIGCEEIKILYASKEI